MVAVLIYAETSILSLSVSALEFERTARTCCTPFLRRLLLDRIVEKL